jgi:hypothetical protein
MPTFSRPIVSSALALVRNGLLNLFRSFAQPQKTNTIYVGYIRSVDNIDRRWRLPSSRRNRETAALSPRME